MFVISLPATALPLSLMLSLAGGFASSVRAQTPAEPPALAGPAIARSSTPSLVEWTYAGRLKELDALPEEAAITRMSLSNESRQRVDAVIAKRQSFIDDVMAENLMLALEIDAATKAEEKLRTARLSFEFLSKLEPLCAEPPLRAQIAEALTREEATLFLRTLAEYDTAYLADAAADTMRKVQGPVGIALERAGYEFQSQIERSFARLESSGRLGIEYVLAQLQLPEAQNRHVRDSVGSLIGANPEGMSEQEYGRVFLAIAAHLTEEQRTKLAEILHGL